MPSPSEAGGVPPEGHEPRNAPAPGSPEEALRRLEQRLDQASEAARRLMAQAAEEAIRASSAGGASRGGAGEAGGSGAGGAGRGGAGEAGSSGAGRAGRGGVGGAAPVDADGADRGGAGDRSPAAAGGPAPVDADEAGSTGDSADGAGDPQGADPLDPPPAGWQTADDGDRDPTSELDPLVALAQAMRDLIPPDLQQRLIAALREVLLALRALIDWYLERLDRQREQGVEVQDIPIL